MKTLRLRAGKELAEATQHLESFLAQSQHYHVLLPPIQ